VKPVRVLHPITRLIVGGAQENTMLTADLLTHDPGYGGKYQVDILSGPQTGREGSLIEECRRRGLNLQILPLLRREINPLIDLRALFVLRTIMRSGNYHIVHTHSSKAGILGRFAARLAGVPLIVHTVHGWSFHDKMSPQLRLFYVLLERAAARLSDALIVVSATDIEKGVNHGIGRPGEYTLIRSGIELDRFGRAASSRPETRESLGVPAGALLVGSVTRLSPQKAPLDLVDAFARVSRSHTHAHFLIVGDGPMRPQVEQRVATAGLADRVHLTGLRRDIPELMAAMDLFVLSSLWEGLPRVLPQAMATGLPIVCTAADGSAEAVVHEETGIVVDPGKPAQLAEGILRLAGDAAYRRRLGENGRRKATSFGARQMVADIDILYQGLLASKRSGI
jgi:glycosyltransferase involved in cell wall biosynthesis